MKIYKITILIICILFNFNSFSEEIKMESSNMNIIDSGNTILAENPEIIIDKDKVYITSKKAKYNKVMGMIQNESTF